MPARREPPPPPPGFWEQVDAHVKLLEKNNYKNSAVMLCLYEQERKRQQTAIKNLEEQLARMASQSIEYAKLKGIMGRAGYDLDTIVRTDEIFGDQ